MPCVWYHYRSSSEVNWVDWWTEELSLGLFEDAQRVRQSEIFSFVKSHLPSNGAVLEGGCGRGGWVQALTEEGYSVIGLDFSFPLVQSICFSNPQLPVVQGDVAYLPLKDGSLSAYLSFGVVEHFPNGPEQALREAWRVLKSGGVLLVSVPYYNYIRRLWMPFDRLMQRLKGDPVIRKLFRRRQRFEVFYQYGFGVSEFTNILKRCGFEVLEHTFYEFRYGLFRDSRHFRRLLSEKTQERLANMLSLISPAICAHMVLFVARKNSHD